MAEYLIQDTTLTAIADEVRELFGTAEQLSTDVIISNLDTANAEINNQADLIAKIKAKAESLPDAGSGGTDLPAIESISISAIPENYAGTIGKGILLPGTYKGSEGRITNGTTVLCDTLSEYFGDVPASAVAEGYTFTSAAGFKTNGAAKTYQSQSISITQTSEKEYDITAAPGFYPDGIYVAHDVTDVYDAGFTAGVAASGAASNIISGTVTSNEHGEITFPMPEFEPRQIMVWNIREVDFDDYIGHDGVMLCAVKLQSDHWIAHYMANQSGTYYIGQASAERGPFENEVSGYSWTNIYETDNSLVWRLGGTSGEDSINDFTDITLNYVLIG